MITVKPNENIYLYGLDNFFFEIADLYKKRKMPNRIILSGKKGLGKSTLSYHLINYILSTNEDLPYDQKNLVINKNNKSYKLVKNNSHPNFYLIDLFDGKKNINIDQIREMISYTNKSSFNNLPKFILIDHIEFLSKNSINALLKVVEEPNDNVFFFFINNSEHNLLPTLNSRCIKFNINLTFNEVVNICNSLNDVDLFKLINPDLISYYNTPGEIISFINFFNEKKINLQECTLKDLLLILINKAYYKKDKFVKNLIINFIELFFLKQYKLSKTNKYLLKFYKVFINKAHNIEKFNLDEESLFLEFRSKILND